MNLYTKCEGDGCIAEIPVNVLTRETPKGWTKIYLSTEQEGGRWEDIKTICPACTNKLSLPFKIGPQHATAL